MRLDPLRHMRALEAACHEIANENRPGYDKNGKNDDFGLFLRAMLEKSSHRCFFVRPRAFCYVYQELRSRLPYRVPLERHP